MTLEERELEIYCLAQRLKEEGMPQTAEILQIIAAACEQAKTTPVLCILKQWAEENLPKQHLSSDKEKLAEKLESLAAEIRKL